MINVHSSADLFPSILCDPYYSAKFLTENFDKKLKRGFTNLIKKQTKIFKLKQMINNETDAKTILHRLRKHFNYFNIRCAL